MNKINETKFNNIDNFSADVNYDVNDISPLINKLMASHLISYVESDNYNAHANTIMIGIAFAKAFSKVLEQIKDEWPTDGSIDLDFEDTFKNAKDTFIKGFTKGWNNSLNR